LGTTPPLLQGRGGRPFPASPISGARKTLIYPVTPLIKLSYLTAQPLCSLIHRNISAHQAKTFTETKGAKLLSFELWA